MSKFTCKACGCTFPDSEIVMKDGNERCPECGNVNIEPLAARRIILTFYGYEIKWHKDKHFGRDDFRKSEFYKFVSSPQFSLKKKEDGWSIVGEKNVVNPTFLDGQDVAGNETPIKDHSEVFIGNKSSGNGLLIKINFEK